MIEEDKVGCERAATNWPVAPDSHPYHGVKVTADGHIEWVQGNLGDVSLTTIDYQTYHTMGWTIIASSSGTRFINDRTGARSSRQHRNGSKVLRPISILHEQ